ncbi:hypothetical protein [Celeribacter litoreus]|uniref:hypothetical protein n=1 Tax=Celeribacter litoreus TaxID=2876714 RepID=UPI001CCC1DD0|nr:hypothetical protein [Celeribacter litoreus]MCA0042717.1 hypothetical protein [Celeribacter litoreus]
MRWIALCAALGLSACQMSLPGLEAPVAESEEGAVEAPAEAEVSKSGFFSFLKPKSPATSTDVEEIAFSPRPETFGVEQEVAPSELTAHAPKKSIFGFLSGGEKEEVAPVSTVKTGEVLPFGEIGVNCEISKRKMGKKVEQSPSTGSAQWKLYDSDAESTEPRSQYITGFSDGCARQVTASLVMFGSAQFHEFLRYEDSNDTRWSDADKAYEKIKRQSCGVGRGKPCPADQRGPLDQQVAFVTVYPQFESGNAWVELLLNAGELVSEEEHEVEE